MDSLAALGNELGDRRGFIRCFQQFHSAFANRDHRDPHLFMRNRLFMHDLEAQLLVEFPRLRQVLYCDTQMVDGGHLPNSRTISSTSVYGSRRCSAISAASSE